MGRGSQVGGFIDDGYHIAGPNGLGRFTGSIDNLDQGGTTRGNGIIAMGHDFGGFCMTGLFDTLHQVHGCADFFKRLAGVLNGFIRGLPGSRMGRHDLGISRFQGTECQTANGGFRIGAGHHVGNHADGFGIFANTQCFIFLDEATGLGITHVIQRTKGLVLDFVDLVFGIADTRLIHGHMTQFMSNILLHKLPCHGLHHFVDFLLGPEFNLLESLAGAVIHL